MRIFSLAVLTVCLYGCVTVHENRSNDVRVVAQMPQGCQELATETCSVVWWHPHGECVPLMKEKARALGANTLTFIPMGNAYTAIAARCEDAPTSAPPVPMN